MPFYQITKSDSRAGITIGKLSTGKFDKYFLNMYLCFIHDMRIDFSMTSAFSSSEKNARPQGRKILLCIQKYILQNTRVVKVFL